MVLLHVKRGEESLFLHSCTLEDNVSEVGDVQCSQLCLRNQVLPKLVNIHNGRRKILRLADEVAVL